MEYFFILSLGRTGTKFLSHLLNSISGFEVKHEPFESDKDLLIYSYLAKTYSNISNQLLTDRFKTIRSQKHNIKIYGEVNSYLRYNTEWLVENLNAKIFYIARNGKDYIKSAYSRKVYTNNEPQFSIVPKDNDPFSLNWISKSRFEKLCWYWKNTNEYLYKESNQNILLFEKLITDYDYFKANILMPLKIDTFNMDQWKINISKPRNTSCTYILKQKTKNMFYSKARKIETIQKYENWTDEMKISFNEICGPTMQKLGYDL